MNTIRKIITGWLFSIMSLPLPVSIPDAVNFQVKNEPPTVKNEITSDLQISLSKDAPITLSNPVSSQISFNIGDSAAETMVKAQKTARVEVGVARTVPNRTEGPSFEVKRQLVKEIASRYSIDWKILEAVWQVETGKRWDTSVSSGAGATGPMQFMPGTFRGYAQDGNGDGKTDIYKAEDALASAANMLSQRGLKDGDVRSALFAYNHADWYVKKVQGIAERI